MEINEMAMAIHNNAAQKGFWDDYIESTSSLKDDLAHPTRDAYISQKLMLVVSELSEAMEALRLSRFANRESFDVIMEESKNWNMDPEGVGVPKFNHVFGLTIKDTFEDELADAMIRILDLGMKMGVDMDWHIQKKMQYNGTRPYKHNKHF